MACYERFVDGVKVQRAFTVDDTDEDKRLAALADAGENGWLRVEDPLSKPSRRRKPSAE